MNVWASCALYTTYLVQNRAWESLELELQVIVSHQCGYWESNLADLED